MKWQMNMPVDPRDRNALLEWCSIRPGPPTKEQAMEWDAYLVDKIIGEPRAAERMAEEYKAMGWVGIYEAD